MTMTITAPALSRADAERLTARAFDHLEKSGEHWQAGVECIREALAGNAAAVLGYPSDGAYISDRFAGVLAGLGIDARRGITRELADAGLSTRAIAPVLGVSVGTVHADRQVFSTEHLPEPDPGDQVEPTPAPAPVVGIDGKAYRRPASEPRRKPITDQFFAAVLDLGKRINTLARLVDDDRFAHNRRAVAAHELDHLQDALDTLETVVAALNEPEPEPDTEPENPYFFNVLNLLLTLQRSKETRELPDELIFKLAYALRETADVIERPAQPA